MRRRFLPPRFAFTLRRGNRAIPRFLRVLLILFIVAVALFFYIESGLRPTVERVASARASYIATKTINDAIYGEIENGGIMYDDFIIFEKDSQNRITALQTNMANVNRLRSRMVNLILEKINDIDMSEISIPIGTIINGELFAGRGPRIPVRLMPVGATEVSFNSIFSSAGINQTRHQILMNVTLRIDIILPGYSISSTVTVEVNVAETIIVGNVPESYAYFGDQADLLGISKYMLMN